MSDSVILYDINMHWYTIHIYTYAIYIKYLQICVLMSARPVDFENGVSKLIPSHTTLFGNDEKNDLDITF